MNLNSFVAKVKQLPTAAKSAWKEFKELVAQRQRIQRHLSNAVEGSPEWEIGTHDGFIVTHLWYVNRLWVETKDLPIVTIPIAAEPMKGFVANEEKIARLIENPSDHPIIVVKDLIGYRVIDGNHRVETARRLGQTQINARVIDVKSSHEKVDKFGANARYIDLLKNA